MKYIVNVSRYFVGILFMISGLVKVNDPLGFSYKLTEYFSPEVLNLPILIPYALLISIFIVVFETLLGLLLVIGYKKRFITYNLLLMILFFTFLTFYSAYYNKVTDCGCFGDALKLTPWQSFYKDVVLLILIVTLFFKRDLITPLYAKNYLKITLYSGIFICFSIVYYALMHLPLIDFLPYKVGVNIQQGMEIPKNAPKSVYDDIWYYKVKGEVKEFRTEEQPWYIEGAEFVDRKTTLISKGYEPPIHDFTVELDGADYTQDVLTTEKVILIVTYNLEKSEKEGLKQLEILHQKALKKGYTVVGLTASLPEVINQVKENNQITFDFYACDETALKTVIRSNPGVLLLNKGTIKQKIHWNDVDDLEL